MNSLDQYLSVNVFILLSVLKDSFPPLAFIVSDEKSVINHVVLWYMMSCFSLIAIKIHS